MRISYNWLKTLLDLPESPELIGSLLTGTGLEVEGIEEVETIKGGLRGVVIGEVLTCIKHPDADKLSVTTVDVGGEKPLDIVCGAPNVAAGQKVVVATVGATLHPEGSDQPLIIKKAKIRGAVSEGMICAEDELGMGTSHAGILVLDTKEPNGTPAATHFNVDSDHVFEIGLTPNRADAASHYGVARDLRAVLDRSITLPSVGDFGVASRTLPVSVQVEDYEAAPRYCGLTMSGLSVGPSPEWLRQRLESIGIRPINNVVDVTNYVCHELGQPLHAFDAAAVTGGQVVVKTLPEGTAFVTLDGVERKLAATDLMICNAETPMCIAGVFGGTQSGVTTETKAIFLESAYFAPAWIRRTAQHHSLKTDASFRYERGTDPNMPLFALKRAALLLAEIAGGEVSSEVIDLYPEPIPDFVVPVKYRNIDRLIGKKLERSLIKSILGKLDIQIRDESETDFVAVVPPYRVDVAREADIIEEILRIYGFDNVELSAGMSSDFLSDFPLNDPDKLRLRCAEMLVANGFYEIINNSLTKPEGQAALADELLGQPVPILNYLSEDLSVMRQSMVFQGLETLAYNVNRQQGNLKLFEFGKTYHKVGEKYVEKEHLCVWMTGDALDESWRQPSQVVQYHDLATAVQRILGTMKVGETATETMSSGVLQAGVAYALNKKTVANLGLVRPALTKKAGLKTQVWYADFDWDYLLKQYSPVVQYEEVPRFPRVRRDLSLVLDKAVSFEQLRQVAYRTERKLLKDVNVFDVYEGESLGGKKAYALSFALQDDRQTLTDQVIDRTMQRLMSQFEKDLGAVIRK